MVSGNDVPFPHAMFPCKKNVVTECFELEDKVVPPIFRANTLQIFLSPHVFRRVQLDQPHHSLFFGVGLHHVETQLEDSKCNAHSTFGATVDLLSVSAMLSDVSTAWMEGIISLV